MTQQHQSDQELVEELRQYAKQLAYSGKSTSMIIDTLVEYGLDRKRASIITYNLDYEVTRYKRKVKSINIMIVGGMILGVGTLATYLTGSNTSVRISADGYVCIICILIMLNFTGIAYFLQGWAIRNE